jgi:sulfonate transport system permease protein
MSGSPSDTVLTAGVAAPHASATADESVESPAAGPGARRRALRLLGAAGLPLLLLGAWQLSTSLGWFSVVQLPSPGMVLAAGIELFERGQLLPFIAVSTQRVLTGFVIGASLGLLLGALTGLSRAWDTALGSTLGAIRAVPSLAWVPLLILWLKIGEESKVTLIAIGAFFPVYTTVAGSLRHVDRHLVEAGRAFGLAGYRLFTTIQLPAVVPSVVSGRRLALAQAWLFLVAAELIASSAGLGFLLVDSQNNGRVDRILLAIVMLAVLGKTTDALLGVFERWAIRRWT